jgi:hypothetical protein
LNYPHPNGVAAFNTNQEVVTLASLYYDKLLIYCYNYIGTALPVPR